MSWIEQYLDWQEDHIRQRRIDAMVKHRPQGHLAYTTRARRADDLDEAMKIHG